MGKRKNSTSLSMSTNMNNLDAISKHQFIAYIFRECLQFIENNTFNIVFCPFYLSFIPSQFLCLNNFFLNYQTNLIPNTDKIRNTLFNRRDETCFALHLHALIHTDIQIKDIHTLVQTLT